MPKTCESLGNPFEDLMTKRMGLPFRPSWWWSGCSCCPDSGGGACGPCTSSAAIYQITVAGITNPGGCGACVVAMNGSFDLTYTTLRTDACNYGSCHWDSDQGMQGCTGCGVFACCPLWTLVLDGSGSYASLIGAGGALYQALYTDFQCFGSTVFTLVSTVGAPCATYPGTITVSAAP